MSTELIGVRRDSHPGIILPATPRCAEAVNALPLDREFRAVITFPRNLRHHQFYWSLLSLVVDNHDHYQTSEALHLWLKMTSGYTDEVAFHDGQVYVRISSASFWGMDQATFRTFFDKAITLILTQVLPGARRPELVGEVERRLRIRYDGLWKKGN